MSNDAKLGLIVGVGVVLAIAFTFYRQEAMPNLPFTGSAAAAAVGAPKVVPAASQGANRRVRGRPTVENERNAEPASPTSRLRSLPEGASRSDAPRDQTGLSSLPPASNE
jgi:hypothetical protein